MNEMIFLVEDSPEGGYSARAVNYSIFTDADSVQELKNNIRDAVMCHFELTDLPKLIRLHFVHDEVFSLT